MYLSETKYNSDKTQIFTWVVWYLRNILYLSELKNLKKGCYLLEKNLKVTELMHHLSISK